MAKTPLYRLIFDWFEMPFAIYRSLRCELWVAERMIDLMDEMPENRKNKIPIKSIVFVLKMRLAIKRL